MAATHFIVHEGAIGALYAYSVDSVEVERVAPILIASEQRRPNRASALPDGRFDGLPPPG